MKIPYTVVRAGHRYYQPRGRMLQLGFRPSALGPEGEEARRKGLALHERWIAIRDGEEAPAEIAGVKRTKQEVSAAKRYPRGSIGAAWQDWTRSGEWARLAPATRNKVWWEAWTKRIEPVFAHYAPDVVTFQAMSAWRAKIEATSGLNTAHKALKVWRAFWRIMKSMRYTQLSDPSEKVVNTEPDPRKEHFKHGEAVRLAKGAWRMNYRGLACIIMIAWDAGFSPVDCRTLRARHKKTDPATRRTIFDRSEDGRQKTGRPVIGTMSGFGDFLCARYLAEFGATPVDEAFLFRMRSGVPYGESRLGNDFAKVRMAVMPGDKRQLRDMRRSGVMETFEGGGRPENVSEKFGNTISRSNRLEKTYNPVDIGKVKLADEARLKGRRRRNKA